jgi:sec-independent protein translocase protein TatB
MLDLPSFDEWLVIAVVAIIVIGPKDLPMALRTLGKWIAKVRSVSGHFRSGIETMIREAELEEMEAKWRDQNAAIMEAHPEGVVEPASAEAAVPQPLSKAEVMAQQAAPQHDAQLPLPPP